jgi:hypothetical protein
MHEHEPGWGPPARGGGGGGEGKVEEEDSGRDRATLYLQSKEMVLKMLIGVKDKEEEGFSTPMLLALIGTK